MNTNLNNKRVLFFGTPGFAKDILSALTENSFNVVGVVCQPDKPKGRGMKDLSACPVKEFALSNSLPVYQPVTLKDNAFENELSLLAPDVIVVAAYGKILPAYVIDYPEYGCINVHGSLLPEYRGAAPVQRAIIDGKEITGITTMLMDYGLDTGNMLLKREINITHNMNSAELFEKMSEAGKEIIVETLNKCFERNISPESQDESQSSYAAKLTSEEARINWSDTRNNIHNKIRGFAPFLECYTILDGKKLKIVTSDITQDCVFNSDSVCGEVVQLGKKAVFVKCSDGVLALTSLKPEGKGAMTPSDMINGRKISLGSILG